MDGAWLTVPLHPWGSPSWVCDLSIQRPFSPRQNVSLLKAMFGGLSQRHLHTKIICALLLISRSKSDAGKVSPHEVVSETCSYTCALRGSVRPLVGMLKLERQFGKHERRHQPDHKPSGDFAINLFLMVISENKLSWPVTCCWFCCKHKELTLRTCWVISPAAGENNSTNPCLVPFSLWGLRGRVV